MTRSFQTSTKIILIHGNGGATGADEQTILIGHSSGAVAAMRFAERNTSK